MNELIQCISVVGFPIVACLLCGWYVKYTGDTSQKMLFSIMEKHDKEMQSVTEAVNNNTMAIKVLTERLGVVNESK